MTAMNAVISSTISPRSGTTYGGARSAFSVAERLNQTVATVESLMSLGIERVVLVDNSEELPEEAVDRLSGADIVRVPTTSFENKGLSEAWMLSDLTQRVRLEGPVLKVSGRYTVGALPDVDWNTFAVAGTFEGKQLVTRCYMTRDAEALSGLMKGALRSIYAYQGRIVGPGSLKRLIRGSLNPAADPYPYHDPRISLEQGCYMAIQHGRIPFFPVASFGVRGVIGGGEGAGVVIDE